MAFRTWAKALSATVGVGALVGASELGMAYGLGVVRLTRVVDVTTRDQWTAQLAWVVWFPMIAAAAGALAGATLLRRWSPSTRIGVRAEVALSFAAALGAAVIVPLTMQPARTARIAGVDPVVVIAICTGIGALVGVFAAWAALAQRVARWSLATVTATIWVVALASVAPSLAPSDPLPAVRLGVLDIAALPTDRTALATMPALALVIGLILGIIARRRGLSMLTIALAGLPGPALLTVSYLVAGPGAGADHYQMTPYWAAMTATGAGVLGSVLAAVLRRPPAEEDDSKPAAATPATPPATPADAPATPAGAPATSAGASGRPAGASPAGASPAGASPAGASPAGASPAGASPAGASVRPDDTPAAGSKGPAPVDTGVIDLPATPRPQPPAAAPANAPARSPLPPAGPAAQSPQRADSPTQELGATPPATPRRRGSVADAFRGRTGEFPVRGQHPASAQHLGSAQQPLAMSHPSSAQQPLPVQTSASHQSAAPRPVPHGRPGQPLTPEPPRISAPIPEPRVSAPITQPEPRISAPVPQPEPRISAPVAQPDPRNSAPVPAQEPRISAPIPGPDGTIPEPPGPAQPESKGLFGRGRRKNARKEEDYADWVSGLGK
ncbi:hypothetical protein [Actinoplanes sp. RD1]|uniref:hypothetical protein n=1 Tax=Actinoplanes sp. RD1 TaxID=3064538 RepID=UPI0027422D90|nr:hypothetical protein [Actinoplanes sp. RD1]